MGNILTPTPVEGVCPNCGVNNQTVINVPGKAGTSGHVHCDAECGRCGVTVTLTGDAVIR